MFQTCKGAPDRGVVQGCTLTPKIGKEHRLAGRLQRAVGTFIDQQGDVALYFTILHLQVAVDDDLALN